MEQNIIPFKNLKHLKTYEYTSSDLSITRTYILNPYIYENIIKWIPKTIAPNVITLSGFLFIIIQVIICAIYAPTMTERDVPSWVFATSAICLFCYQTLDNIDGKQARRTKQCSPLGELFDHGVDALTCTLGSISWMTACAQGMTIYSLMILVAPMVPFIYCTWEEYHVGGLNLGYVNGPIEGLLFVQSGQWICAIGGQDFVHQTLKDFLHINAIPDCINNLKIHEALNIFTMGLVLLNLTSNIKTVFAKVTQTTERVHAFVIELIPFYIFFIAYSTIVIYSDVVKENVYTYVVGITLLFGYMGSSITLRFLLKSPIKIHHPLLYLFTTNAMAAYFGVEKTIQLRLLQFTTGIIILYYAYFVYVITNTISTFLNIGILRILPKEHQE
mmetsp:Transcript_145/g.249  ORF Transcript_145/g.249 Transcript_145/m.249 type:complete len:387 (+) Transcript_145:70-1230(+)